ncbi:hypothetical protein [Nonomuraea sp. LPB2021202275-12-8]
MSAPAGFGHMDVIPVTSTEWMARNTLKMFMAALALIGITGSYLFQVKG